MRTYALYLQRLFHTAAVAATLLIAHGAAMAGGFVGDDGDDVAPPVMLAEFRAPAPETLVGPTFPSGAPKDTSRGFRAPEPGPDDEVAVGHPKRLPPSDNPLDIELAPLAPSPAGQLGAPASNGLAGDSVTSLAGITAPADTDVLLTLPAGITRLPLLEDIPLPADGLPTLDDADAKSDKASDKTSDDGTTDEKSSSEELPAPDGDGKVEDITVGGVPIKDDVIETYGWGYLGTWLDNRMIPQRVEAGGNYRSGTVNSWSVLLKSSWKVEEKHYDDDLTFNGTFTEVDRQRSNNEWIARDTFDWKRVDGSPWRCFVKTYAEYDEIEKLSFRGTASTGLGYAWFNEDDRKLITRVGPSYTFERYFNPQKTVDKPEMLAELELNWRFFDQMVLEHKASAYPAFRSEDGVRLYDDTGLLTPIGTSPFWSWKLGLRHQYNNKPNTDVARNTYQASLMLVYDR